MFEGGPAKVADLLAKTASFYEKEMNSPVAISSPDLGSAKKCSNSSLVTKHSESLRANGDSVEDSNRNKRKLSELEMDSSQLLRDLLVKKLKTTQEKDQMFEAFQPWALKTYGDETKTKTITKKKKNRILKALLGQERSKPDSSKFRFWVKSKGFTTKKPESFDQTILTNLSATSEDCVDLYVASSMKEFGEKAYRLVACVEDFFDIIYNVHVEFGGRSGKHAGQKRTYRIISETYAFLPREAVTKFLAACPTCQKNLPQSSRNKLDEPTISEIETQSRSSCVEEKQDIGVTEVLSKKMTDAEGLTQGKVSVTKRASPVTSVLKTDGSQIVSKPLTYSKVKETPKLSPVSTLTGCLKDDFVPSYFQFLNDLAGVPNKLRLLQENNTLSKSTESAMPTNPLLNIPVLSSSNRNGMPPTTPQVSHSSTNVTRQYLGKCGITEPSAEEKTIASKGALPIPLLPLKTSRTIPSLQNVLVDRSNFHTEPQKGTACHDISTDIWEDRCSLLDWSFKTPSKPASILQAKTKANEAKPQSSNLDLRTLKPLTRTYLRITRSMGISDEDALNFEGLINFRTSKMKIEWMTT